MMNIWINRLKFILFLSIGLASVVGFLILSFSILICGVVLGCVLFLIQLIKHYFRPSQQQPSIQVDENGHLIIEHDPS